MRTRREYLAAFATILGTSVAGCSGDRMSEDEANDVLDDVQSIGRIPNNGDEVTRAIDREAGVVLYLAGIGANYGGGLTAVPIDETPLD